MPQDVDRFWDRNLIYWWSSEHESGYVVAFSPKKRSSTLYIGRYFIVGMDREPDIQYFYVKYPAGYQICYQAGYLV